MWSSADDNAFSKRPVMVCTQILVQRWGTRTRISALFHRTSHSTFVIKHRSKGATSKKGFVFYISPPRCWHYQESGWFNSSHLFGPHCKTSHCLYEISRIFLFSEKFQKTQTIGKDEGKGSVIPPDSFKKFVVYQLLIKTFCNRIILQAEPPFIFLIEEEKRGHPAPIWKIVFN